MLLAVLGSTENVADDGSRPFRRRLKSLSLDDNAITFPTRLLLVPHSYNHVVAQEVRLPIVPLVGFANLAHMGAALN